jgi:hypothetical protein
MQAYKLIIAENTTLVLSTGSDLSEFLKAWLRATISFQLDAPPRNAENATCVW